MAQSIADMTANLQARYDSELERCYCTRRDCDYSCEIASFCENIADGLVKRSVMKEMEIAFTEQSTVSRVLRGGHGDWCEMFADNAKEMDSHMNFIRGSVFRAVVVMQFIYDCNMGVFRTCRDRMIHLFHLDPNGRISPENGDFVHRIITNPEFNFARLLRSSFRILDHEIKRIEFTKDCVSDFLQFLELQLPQVELNNQNLIHKVEVEKRIDLEKAMRQHTFLWKTYEVWDKKNRNFLMITENFMTQNLSKLVRMRDMHIATLRNWNDFSRIPPALHPRNFECLFIKV
ncbi:hypothetical protein CAEBREN_13608 [Caenorhabditis brenneri]|uniref:Uncharacterized protein n=1 Tax=Caenorhabditis brenneri TaxID=135651 RepID=G0MBL4_CAEBE|nr:hypothetical protein CAEBREN_13608 [Caenorhabditis brenneri]